MRRKFYPGYRQGTWEIIELPYKSTKALMRCDCGYEGWHYISNLSSHGSTKCYGCRVKSIEHKTFISVINTANRRGIKWEITFEEWKNLSSKNCFYCNAEPSNCLNSVGDLKYNGLDRIDSSKHYYLENVVTCCLYCNRAKSNKSQEDFFKWIETVYVKTKSI